MRDRAEREVREVLYERTERTESGLDRGNGVLQSALWERYLALVPEVLRTFVAGGGVAVMLIHARTDTKWFHEWVYGKADLYFVRGRLHFNGSKWNAPFPSLVAVYRPEMRL